jgi:hypothetical protein
VGGRNFYSSIEFAFYSRAKEEGEQQTIREETFPSSFGSETEKLRSFVAALVS